MRMLSKLEFVTDAWYVFSIVSRKRKGLFVCFNICLFLNKFSYSYMIMIEICLVDPPTSIVNLVVLKPS